MPLKTQHLKRYFPTSATPSKSQYTNFPSYSTRRPTIWRAQQTLHNSKQNKQPPLYLRNCSQDGLNIFPYYIPISFKMKRGRHQQIISTRSTSPHQGHTVLLMKYLSNHQGRTLRNLQGWTREGPVPIWYQEVIKIPGHGMHWHHNAKKTAKQIQLPIKLLEWPSNTCTWSKAQRGKFGRYPLQTSWYS